MSAVKFRKCTTKEEMNATKKEILSCLRLYFNGSAGPWVCQCFSERTTFLGTTPYLIIKNDVFDLEFFPYVKIRANERFTIKNKTGVTLVRGTGRTLEMAIMSFVQELQSLCMTQMHISEHGMRLSYRP